MKVACILMSHFRMKAELRRHAKLRGRPTVVVDRTKARPLVLDSSPEAEDVTEGTHHVSSANAIAAI